MNRTPAAPADPLPLDRAAPLEELERVERLVLARGETVENLDWLAFMFFTHRRPEKARAYYERLVERQPENASYRWYLGELLAAAGEREAASKHLEKVVALDREGQYATLARAKLAVR